MSAKAEFKGTINEAIGRVEEKREKIGGHAPNCGRQSGARCAHPSHMPDRRVFLNDRRNPPVFNSRHESGEWICYYTTPSEKLLDLWVVFGYEREGRTGWGLSSIEVFEHPSGNVWLILKSGNFIGGLVVDCV